MARGRPTKLTRKTIAEVCNVLSKGVYRNIACKIVGIHPSSFHRWYLRGKKDYKGIYVDFCNAVDKAEAEAEYFCSRIWISSAKADWYASFAFLKCRYPERWGLHRFEKENEISQKRIALLLE